MSKKSQKIEELLDDAIEQALNDEIMASKEEYEKRTKCVVDLLKAKQDIERQKEEVRKNKADEEIRKMEILEGSKNKKVEITAGGIESGINLIVKGLVVHDCWANEKSGSLTSSAMRLFGFIGK